MQYRARRISRCDEIAVTIPGEMRRVCELALELYRKVGLGMEVGSDEAEEFERVTELVLEEAIRQGELSGSPADFPGYGADGLAMGTE